MNMDENEIDQIKKEISFHSLCKPCRGCGECEKILDLVLKERRESRDMPRSCDSCRL